MADAKTEARKYPPPPANPETRPFWDAAAQGKLLIKRCTACGEAHYYPRTICPFCFSDKTEWVEASGKGTIYTFSVMRTPPALRDRLRHAGGRARAADQHRRLRTRQAEDRAGGEGGVQADRRRAAADVHAGVSSRMATPGDDVMGLLDGKVALIAGGRRFSVQWFLMGAT